MNKMQDTINRWEGGLKATGGAIQPQKSWVYPISFKFDNNGLWEYKSSKEINFHFNVKDHMDIITPLEKLNPTIGKETLGVFLAPDGNNNEMLQQLRNKSDKWAQSIIKGHLSPTEAWLALETTIMKSISYSLPALTLTEKQCQFIMAPALKAGLNASHICRSFPCNVLYSSKKEGGFGLSNIYHEQGISHLLLLQQHIDQPSITSNLL